MIERYSHKEHYSLVSDWLRSRGMGVPDQKMFSDLGFVIDRMAVGFLYVTNSPQAFISDVAADPKVLPRIRGNALDRLFELLEAEARNRNIEVVHVYTSLLAMRERLEKSDFVPVHGKYSVFYKELRRP